MTGGLCRTCGAAVHPGDQFCGHCGASVGMRPPAAPADSPAVSTILNPIAVAPKSTVPPPVGVPAKGGSGGTTATPSTGGIGRRTVRSDVAASRKGTFLAGFGGLVAVAAIAWLTVTLISTRDDLDNERAKVAQAESVVTTVAPASGGEGGALHPIDPTQDPTVALQAQLDDANAALVQAKNDLANEQKARTDDAAAATAAAATAEATAAAAEATAAADRDALQQQLTSLEGLFPMTPASIAKADPVGQYVATLTAGECTLTACGTLAALSIDITSATTITGDRTNGALAFDGTTYTNSGTLDPSIGPQCAGAAVDPSYSLSFVTSTVAATAGALQATQLMGTYTETINTGTCAGQHRTYKVTMTRR